MNDVEEMNRKVDVLNRAWYRKQINPCALMKFVNGCTCARCKKVNEAGK